MMVVLGLGVTAQAPTSENTPRLKKALEHFPEADKDKDGVLTMGEARAFMKARGGGGRTEAKPEPAEALEGAKRHIYKKVGKVELPLYVFQPAGHQADAKAPAIVFFFGGGWRSGSPTQFAPQCEALSKRGMVAITVEYRVSSRHPETKVEDCVEDAKSAMRWVRAHAKKLGVDPDRIASGGGSAGGHLAACTALVEHLNAESDDAKVSARPNAMVLFNPAMGWDQEDAERRQRSGDRSRGPMEKVMPLTYASEKQPPCIMFFGTADGLLKGAELFRDRSKKAGNSCKIVTYEGQGHGFFNQRKGGGKYYELTLAEADKFLVGLGWLEKQ